MTRALLNIVLFAVVAALGVGAGWLLGSTGSGGGEAEDAHEDEPTGLSPAALKELGVTVAPLQKTPYARTKRVQALIADRPLARQPVTAPVSGLVKALHVDVGMTVKPAAPLLVIVRDPNPRVELNLTRELLSPLSEKIHDEVSELRDARTQLDIATKEITRLREIDARTTGPLPLVSRQKLIDLEYEATRAETALANSRRELGHHGLSKAEIDELERGGHAPPNVSLWRRSLEVNGLWNKLSDRALAALPGDVGDDAWTTAALGELSATSLLDEELVELFESHAGIGEHFMDVVSLLLSGSRVARIRHLAEVGALEPEVVIQAPKAVASGYDVDELHVRTGVHVSVGDPLLELYDGSTIWLQLQPVGAELALVTEAFHAGTTFDARPLIPGSGPTLEGLHVTRITERADEGVYCVVGNGPIGTPKGEPTRTWALRQGMRYLAEIPIEIAQDRFVLPRDAVARQGLERIVFLENGDTFKAAIVTVDFEDEDVIVLVDDGALFDGDLIAMSGAFDLSLALAQPAGGGDAVGHGHSHD